MRLKNKTVLVSGASKGIGRTLALGMALEGARVIVNYCRDRKGAEAVAKEIRALGLEAMVVQADIANVSHIRRLFQSVRRRPSPIPGVASTPYCRSRGMIFLIVALALLASVAPSFGDEIKWQHLSSKNGELPAPGESDQQTGNLISRGLC